MVNKNFQSSYRVYYEDTDAVGIMYHGNYINFCERARSDMLREIGYPASTTWETLGIGFVVRHLTADYRQRVHLDDLLTVDTSVKEMRNTSFIMTQDILCQNKVVFTMDITIVCLGKDGRPIRIPEQLYNGFLPFVSEQQEEK